jgi:hypothetical protein
LEAYKYIRRPNWTVTQRAVWRLDLDIFCCCVLKRPKVPFEAACSLFDGLEKRKYRAKLEGFSLEEI